MAADDVGPNAPGRRAPGGEGAWPPPLRTSVPTLLLAVGALVAALTFWVDREAASRRVRERAESQLRLVGTLRSADVEASLRRLDSTGARQQILNLNADRLLRAAALVDQAGRVRWATPPDLVGARVGQTRLARFGPLVDRAMAQRTADVQSLDDGATTVGAFPVQLEPGPGQLMSTRYGVLLVDRDVSLWRLEAQADAARAWSVLSALLLLIGIATWWLLTRLVTRRAEALVAATRAISLGDFVAGPALAGADELAHVARAVSRMADALRLGTETLRRREATFRQLLEHGSDVLTIIAADGTVDFVSPSVERVLGHSVETVTGASLFDLVHPDDRARVEHLVLEATRRRGTAPPFELRVRHGDGGWRSLEAIGNRPADWPEESMVVSARDVTQRRQIEDQLRQSQKMEAVGRLAGGVAHDFNNLLTVIRSYTDMVLDALPAGGTLREDAEEVRAAADRAAALTRQLLVFSRRTPPAARAVALCDVVRDMERMVRRLVPESVLLVCDAGPARGVVRADATQLEQVILNLVVNAWDAMPEGGTLRIACDEVETDEEWAAAHAAEVPPARWARLVVSDTGHGMDDETRARLFEPFFTTKPLGKGTGLGLSTVYAIVTQAGGHVTVESDPGRGTTFRLYFPVSDAEAEMPAPPPQPARGGGEAVLLAEDEEAVRHATERLLRRLGYQVTSAADGERALALALRTDVAADVLVTDVVMPRMGGRELAQRAREARPGLPVLYISGYTADAFPSDVQFGPRTRLLAKPFTTEQLASALRELLDA